jgi:putative heme-binding domain-containing protein
MFLKRRASLLLLTLWILASCVNAQQVGQQIFSSTCAACHGLDGRGGEHAPNIATEPKIQALSDLLMIMRNGIASAGMPGFGSTLDQAQMQAVLKYLRILQGQGKPVSITGDAEHGRVLFFGSAGCSGCHAVNGRGGFLGADLTSYGSTHSPAEIRQAIIDPNKNVDPRHGTVIVVTRGGAKYTGVIRNEDNFSLQMQTADGNFHFFEKSAIARIERPTQSLMPSDYESKLGAKDLDDVIAYLVKSSATAPAAAPKDEDE